MPLPEPKSNEKQDDFVGRCISLISKEKDEKGNLRWPDNDQRVAVCFSQWRNKNESMVVTKINNFLNESSVVGDVASYEKPIGISKNSYIQKRDKKWVYLVDEKEVDSDDCLENLKKRIKVEK